MEVYKNLSGKSGVRTYEIEPEGILVKFRNGSTYRYSYRRAGKKHVEAMKKLARRGMGLSSYISRHVKDLFD